MYIFICKCNVYFTVGNISHATVGRIALVMTIAAASGGLCSAIISFSVQVCILSD